MSGAHEQILDELRRMESGGDQVASAQTLLPLVYDELRSLARAKLARERPGNTLPPTGLVHEAFLRIVGARDEPGFLSRQHFFATAARAMRRILVEQARRRQIVRREEAVSETVFEAHLALEADDERLLDVDAALERLALADPRQRAIVEFRFFVGLSVAETADILGVSIGTVERDWRLLKAKLARELEA